MVSGIIDCMIFMFVFKVWVAVILNFRANLDSGASNIIWVLSVSALASFIFEV
ncbi:hypothetical protein RchiOBHm_Chr5g0032641 [Rosa chinensis]|uniref:Uncharacterized protein n=1 Tax=Rosa chinensis TaxID=74649 RepID=A0A2P6QAH4_ROSCH|nr:hypothetical protein RchiOBHm_Chr5g0032641 [Rosa chinensis]